MPINASFSTLVTQHGSPPSRGRRGKTFLILFIVGFIYVQQSIAEDAATPAKLSASTQS
jgi:hypothetical protein